MTLKQIRGRLDRLELSARAKEIKREETYTPPSYDFPIDPAVVQEMQDECAFLFEVKFFRLNFWTNGERRTPEEIQTRARIAALASTIHCPPSYGFQQYWEDVKYRRGLQIYDPERALARVRMEAYKQTPEGHARVRLDYLENGDGYRGLAAYEEMDRLIKLYPEPWCDPRETHRVRYKLQERGTPKDRKLRAEKHQRWINNWEERRHIKIKPGRVSTTHYVKDYIAALRRNGCPTLGNSEPENGAQRAPRSIDPFIVQARIEQKKVDFRVRAQKDATWAFMMKGDD